MFGNPSCNMDHLFRIAMTGISGFVKFHGVNWLHSIERGNPGANDLYNCVRREALEYQDEFGGIHTPMLAVPFGFLPKNGPHLHSLELLP